MKVVLGFKAHSGWAAQVVLGARRGEILVVDRRRVELVEPGEASWAKQPYHAAEDMSAGDARRLVERGIQSARRIAAREMRAAVERARGAEHDVVACSVLMSDPMPAWTVEEILAVHFRMHKAEGVLFRDALARAAGDCGLKVVSVLEKALQQHAERALATPATELAKRIAALGKTAGPPWGKDQKDAALAALIGLQGRSK